MKWPTQQPQIYHMATKTTQTLTSKCFATKTKLRHSRRSLFLSPAARRKCFSPVIGHNKQTCMCQTPPPSHLPIVPRSGRPHSHRRSSLARLCTALHGAGRDDIICFLFNKIERKNESKPQNSAHTHPAVGSAPSHTGAECWMISTASLSTGTSNMKPLVT